MNFVYEALGSSPTGLFVADDITDGGHVLLRDHSGRGMFAIVNNYGAAPPVLSGASRSIVFGGTDVGGFTFPAAPFRTHKNPFSIEFWVLKLNNQSSSALTNTLSENFGIIYDGTRIYFSTPYTSSGVLSTHYDVQENKVFHVVGTHSQTRNSLYVDGELVSYVDIVDEFVDDEYIQLSNNLVSSSSYAINGVSFYEYELTAERVRAHYEAGKSRFTSEDVVGSNGGELIPVALNNSDVFVDQMWQSEEDWSMGESRNIVIERGRLVPSFSEGVSMEGDWIDNFVLPETEDEIYGVIVNWDGYNEIVEVSLDGETWEIATKGARVMTIPEGYIPQGEELHVRVSFVGGVEDDEAFVDNLNVVGLMSGESPEVAGRTVTQTGTSQGREYNPLEFHDNWGSRIETGGSITISKDNTEEELPLRTIEMWVKDVSESVPLPISGDVYVNGEPATEVPVGLWSLVHVVSPVDVVGDFSIEGPRRVGHVAVYPVALTASEISRIYREYSNSTAFRFGSDSPMEITNPDGTTKIYAHDWSIHLSG